VHENLRRASPQIATLYERLLQSRKEIAYAGSLGLFYGYTEFSLSIDTLNVRFAVSPFIYARQ
jgi:hypothetical protein